MNSNNLFGYIDPGSGFILLQVVMAGAIGFVVYFRKMIWKAASLISGRAHAGIRPNDLDSQKVSQGTDLANEPTE